MSDIEIPQFAVILAPIIEPVPAAARPGLLVRLERAAGGRYREWAERTPDEAEGLLECSEREEEIARRVEKLFPVASGDLDVLEAAADRARAAYFEVFAPHAFVDQLTLQASAEREGAAAWRLLAAEQSDEAVKRELQACSGLEEANAAYLEVLVASGRIA